MHQYPLSSWQLIGDGRTGALVGPNGDVGWWAHRTLADDPSFDALVNPTGGFLSSSLRAHSSTSWRRAHNGAVLETVVRSHDAVVRLEDFVGNGNNGYPQGALVRWITVLSGRAELAITVHGQSRHTTPKRTYRSTDCVAWVASDPGSAAIAVHGAPEGGSVTLDQGAMWCLTANPTATDGRIRREEHDRSVRSASRVLRATLDGAYDGPLRRELRGWLLQLLLLTDRTTGALLRSATTSLPAQINGDRQFDGRIAYLEDSARLVRLLERIDRYDRAELTRGWLTDGLRKCLAVGLPRALSVEGTEVPPAIDLMLGGWRGHQPVRRSDDGAAATDLAAIAVASLMVDGSDRSLLRSVGNCLCTELSNATVMDRGRWGSGLGRGNARPTEWTSSALSVRLALRAAIRTERRFDPLSEAAVEWSTAVGALDQRLATDGCFGSGEGRGWRRRWDDDDADAQLLRWTAPADPLVDLPSLPDDAPGEARSRLGRSLDRTLGQLDDHGLLHRHLPSANDGFAPGQGIDVSASADMVTALCRAERWEAAHERMERLCSVIGASGEITATVPSHIDPRSGQHLGNRPDAPGLLSLCEAALALSRGPI